LVADTPGLGKTLEAIAGIVESEVPGPYLVCAPKTSLDVVWERDILANLPGSLSFVVSGTRAQRNSMLNFALGDSASDLSNHWIITNIEMVRTKSFWRCPECGEEWPASDHPKSNVVLCGHNPKYVRTRHEHEYPQLFERPWGAVIMDECQKALLRRSGTPTQTRAGAKLLPVREGGLRIGLSGTPMRGKPERLWGILNWLRPKVYTGYWSWAERYWDVMEGYAGSKVLGEFRTERQEAFNRALDGMVIRRTKEEVSPDLPRKAYMGSPLDPKDPDSPVAVWIPLAATQTKAYAEMLALGSTDIEGGQLNAIGGLAELTRLKQFASAFGRLENGGFRPAFPSNKFDWLVQFLTERSIIDPEDEPTGKVIVVSQFTELLSLFAEELRSKYGVQWRAITGKVTGQKRAEAVDLFNDPQSGINLMFLNTMAGGVSITLDAADDTVFIDETHVPDDQEQAEDRNNNRRPEEKVVRRRYWYLKSLGTVDEAIARVNIGRDRLQKGMLDGRRGVAYVREVFATMKDLKP
jgi:SNF2 family DNA or RNA helicase